MLALKGNAWQWLTHCSVTSQKMTKMTVILEPRFNEVPRDWETVFVISRVCYIKHLHWTIFWENCQNVCYIEVKTVKLQNPAFQPDRKNMLYIITFQYQATCMHSYGTRNSRTGKQNCLTVNINFILVAVFSLSVVTGKIYCQKQHFLPPATVWRFTKIKEVLLKNTQVVIQSDSHMPQENECRKVLNYTQLFFLWATHFGKRTLKIE